MFWTNIFTNTYAAPENRLTYNFLCTIELMGDSQGNSQLDFLNFLLLKAGRSGVALSAKPLVRIDPVYVFQQGSNPDGSLQLRTVGGTTFSVFLEIKTNRRLLDREQLQAHLSNHVSDATDSLLLAITPRSSDSELVKKLDDPRVFFVSWQEIADFLARYIRTNECGNTVIENFLAYANETGEFMCTELERKDIELFISSVSRKPDERIRGAFERLAAEIDLEQFIGPIRGIYQDLPREGIKGIVFNLDETHSITIAIYYDTNSYSIPFKQPGVPDLAVFVDINPKQRAGLSKITEFKEALPDLEALGWEENLTKERTANEWRLLWWRQSLNELNELNVAVLSKILTERLNELTANKGFTTHFLGHVSSNERA